MTVPIIVPVIPGNRSGHSPRNGSTDEPDICYTAVFVSRDVSGIAVFYGICVQPTDAGFGAKVAELVDAQDLGSCGVTRESSSLSFRTIINWVLLF